MDTCDYLALYTYIVGSILWFPLWGWLVGFRALREKRLLFIPFFGALVAFGANILLALYTCIPTYDKELQIYSYVERNATTVAGLALAIAIFVVVRFDKVTNVLDKPSTRLFLGLTFWSFLLSTVGCLPLYWMPPKDYWLTALRHIKTVPYLYSLFILAAAITVFIYETEFNKRAGSEPTNVHSTQDVTSDKPTPAA